MTRSLPPPPPGASSCLISAAIRSPLLVVQPTHTETRSNPERDVKGGRRRISYDGVPARRVSTRKNTPPFVDIIFCLNLLAVSQSVGDESRSHAKDATFGSFGKKK